MSGSHLWVLGASASGGEPEEDAPNSRCGPTGGHEPENQADLPGPNMNALGRSRTMGTVAPRSALIAEVTVVS